MTESLYDFLIAECVKNPEERKIYFGRDITGAELIRDVNAVGGFLQSRGIKKGDVVAICLPNIPQAIVALYAINAVGAVAYVLHPKTGADFLAGEIKNVGAKAVFLLDRFLNKYKKVTENGILTIACRMSDYLPYPEKIVRITEPVLPKGVVVFKETIKSEPFAAVEIKSNDPAVYLNSGGTTGEPKTVVLSNGAFNELAFNVRATARKCEKYVEGMGMLMTLPLFHGFGLGVCVQVGLLVGYVVPVPIFRPCKVIKTMKKIPVNIIVGVPGMLRRLAEKKNFKGEFLRNIRLIFAGGDKVNEEVKRKFEERLQKSGCDTLVMEGYGLSEVASVATINTESPHDGSLGQPIEKVDVKIFIDGKEAAEGEEGEIAVCSPSVTNGYVDGSPCEFFSLDGKNYLATGDIGYKKGESVYFCGRKKRMLKIGGVNVFPSQVEEVATRFVGVKQACAVRTVYKNKPAIKLLIVTDKNIGDEYKSKLTAFIGKNLIKYAEPRIIERVEELKTTPLGKVDYRYYEEN